MSAGIFALVIGAALLHAVWNALVKRAEDPFLGMTAVCLWGGLFAAAVMALLPFPPPPTWPYLAASAALHIIYFWLVGLIYRQADLSTAYPVMRGTAPLITLALTSLALREVPAAGALLGVLLLAGGIVAMGLSGGRKALAASLPLALSVALSIALYTIVDAEGARLAGGGVAAAFAFNGVSDAATAVGLVPVAVAWRGTAFFANVAKSWRRGLAGGAAAYFGYAIIVYAMTEAPIALVAALRETSVLFATLIGVFAFGEKLGRLKGAAVAMIVVGGVALRLGS